MIQEIQTVEISQKFSKPKVFACIAALNEEISIGNMISQIKKYVDKVFVCDDGSDDLTGRISQKMGAQVITHEENRGKGSAIRDLFILVSHYNPDVVVVIDADGQHNAVDIPKLIEPILKGDADLVIGSRFVKGAKTDAPLYRRFGLWLINLIIKDNISDTQSGYRAFSGKAVEIMTKCEEDHFGIETEQIFLARKYKLCIKEVPIEINYAGLFKTSTLNPLTHGIQIMRTIYKYRSKDKPFIFFGIPILVILSLGIISLVLLTYKYSELITINISLAVISLGCFFICFFLASKLLRYIRGDKSMLEPKIDE